MFLQNLFRPPLFMVYLFNEFFPDFKLGIVEHLIYVIFDFLIFEFFEYFNVIILNIIVIVLLSLKQSGSWCSVETSIDMCDM